MAMLHTILQLIKPGATYGRYNGSARYRAGAPLLMLTEKDLLATDWVITTPPQIRITAEDIGRKVRTRSGHIFLVMGYGHRNAADKNCVLIGKKWYQPNGRLDDILVSDDDVVEFIPSPPSSMNRGIFQDGSDKWAGKTSEK